MRLLGEVFDLTYTMIINVAVANIMLYEAVYVYYAYII